jgi:hypothetical protein
MEKRPLLKVSKYLGFIKILNMLLNPSFPTNIQIQSLRLCPSYKGF